MTKSEAEKIASDYSKYIHATQVGTSITYEISSITVRTATLKDGYEVFFILAENTGIITVEGADVLTNNYYLSP